MAKPEAHPKCIMSRVALPQRLPLTCCKPHSYKIKNRMFPILFSNKFGSRRVVRQSSNIVDDSILPQKKKNKKGICSFFVFSERV